MQRVPHVSIAEGRGLVKVTQPKRTILRRWRTNGQQWAELECGHTEPNNDLPYATAIRCHDCAPVPQQDGAA